MKKVLFLLFSLPIFCLAQTNSFPIDTATKKACFTEVVETPGTKAQLYDKALDWFATEFRSSKDVIQVQDKEAGKIIGKWHLLPVDDRMGFVSSTIFIWVKDGRFKYVITDIRYLGTSEFGAWEITEEPGLFKANMTKGAQRKIKKGTYDSIQNVIADLKKSLEKKAIDDF